MTTEELRNNLQRYLDGEIGLDQLEELVKDFPVAQIEEEFTWALALNDIAASRYLEVDAKAAFEAFLKRRRNDPKPMEKKPRPKMPFFRIAAVLLALLGLGYLFTNKVGGLFQKGSDDADRHTATTITIELGNGEVREITANGEAQLYDRDGDLVASQQGNTLVYDGAPMDDKPVFNTLRISFGKRFQLALSDGTKVHLNSGSSLKYPIGFPVGKNREVTLSGEAFFEVAEDADRPFIVKADGVNVRVLGTSFNVSNYAEDDAVSTVLVSGKVGLYSAAQDYSQETAFGLVPNDMGVFNKGNGTIVSTTVDTYPHTAWTKGKLVFRDKSFAQIEKTLERHYNVAIDNTYEKLAENTFNATFDSETIEQVLEVIDRTFGIDYTIEGANITITKP